MSEAEYQKLIEDAPLEGEVLVEAAPNKFEILGKVAKVVAGYGAGVVVGQIIEANVSPKNVVQKVGIYVGSLALCGLAAHHAGNYAKEYVDELVTTVRNVSDQYATMREEFEKARAGFTS